MKLRGTTEQHIREGSRELEDARKWLATAKNPAMLRKDDRCYAAMEALNLSGAAERELMWTRESRSGARGVRKEAMNIIGQVCGCGSSALQGVRRRKRRKR